MGVVCQIKDLDNSSIGHPRNAGRFIKSVGDVALDVPRRAVQTDQTIDRNYNAPTGYVYHNSLDNSISEI